MARTDKTDKSIKEQLQKKVSALENEIIELKEKLHEQIAINDCHKVKISDDFDRWKKQKYWQQNVEKMKNKLKEKDMEMEKLQNTCSGYRMLIERLEREKHNLENRIKALKQTNLGSINVQENEVLKMENVKLLTEIDTLQSKLKMQQHHSGGLGAAMLQEKLEAQERKIAILEVSSKVSFGVYLFQHLIGTKSNHSPPIGARIIPFVSILRGSFVRLFKLIVKSFMSNDNAIFVCIIANRIPTKKLRLNNVKSIYSGIYVTNTIPRPVPERYVSVIPYF